MRTPCEALATPLPSVLCLVSSSVEVNGYGGWPPRTPVLPQSHCCTSKRAALWWNPPESRCGVQSRFQQCTTRKILARANASIDQEAMPASATEAFSRSESELQAQGLELHHAVDDLDLDQLNTLFVKVGFPRRHKERLAKALQHTLSVTWLRELKSKQLVAFARATGDDVFNAVIWDVVVDPGFQGTGLGKVVMERLMFELVSKGISNIALYAEPNVINFYKPMGFVPGPDGIRAMAYSRRRK